jgi:hypothetical protein
LPGDLDGNGILPPVINDATRENNRLSLLPITVRPRPITLVIASAASTNMSKWDYL